MDDDGERKLHQAVGFVGLRAQATAVGLLQLSIELRQAGVLDDDAVSRIKDAIAKDITLSRPRSAERDEYGHNIRSRLDRLFAGDEGLSERDQRPVRLVDNEE